MTKDIVVYTMTYTMKKEPTEDVITQNCIAARMRLLARVVTKVYDDALRPFGLTASQLNLLAVIGRLDPARPSDLCRLLKMDISTVSRNIDRMVAKGWVAIFEDSDDGRAHQFRLTAKGRNLLEKAKPAWDQAQKRTHALLGSGGVSTVMRAAKSLQEID